MVPIPQGRLLGGGSSINAMMYVRGNHRDFDGWRDGGNPGWGYADVLPASRRCGDLLLGRPGVPRAGAGRCGSSTTGPGPDLAWRSPRRPRELGFGAPGSAATRDYNGDTQECGAFFYQSTRTRPTAGAAPPTRSCARRWAGPT